jgi:outer membrane protein
MNNPLRMIRQCCACIILAVALSLAPLAPHAHAQKQHALTLEQALDMAVHHGYSASNVRARYLSARKNARSAQRRLWTSVSLSVTAPEMNEALTQEFNPVTGLYEYYHLKTKSVSASLNISQPIHLTGGTLTFSQGVVGQDQTSGLSSLTQQSRDFFSNSFIEFRQPILTPNLQAINDTRSEIALAQSEAEYLRDQMDLVYTVTESYLNLFQVTRRRDISNERVRQDEESYQTARSKSQSGLIAEVDALQSEVDLASSRNDLLSAEQEVARAKNTLRLLLGIPTEDEVELTEDPAYQPVAIDTGKAISSALTQRADVLSAQWGIDLADANVGSARSQNGFRMDLAARYGLNKRDTEFWNAFRDFDKSNWVSLTLSIPIFDWGSHSLGVEAAEVSYLNATATAEFVKQQVKQEILDLTNRIKVAESRIQVLAKAADVAERSYTISLERYRNGSISRNDLSLAQQRLMTAKISSLSALIDYELGLADLRRKTLWDFAINAPVKPVLGGEE